MTQARYYRIVPILLAVLVLQACAGKSANLTVLGAKEQEKPAGLQVVEVTCCPELPTQAYPAAIKVRKQLAHVQALLQELRKAMADQ